MSSSYINFGVWLSKGWGPVRVRYHWALTVGPKVEEEGGIGVRYHAKERPKLGEGSERRFEERESPLAPTSMLLVRVMVGKVADGNQLVESLRSTPIRQAQPGWNCVLGKGGSGKA